MSVILLVFATGGTGPRCQRSTASPNPLGWVERGPRRTYREVRRAECSALRDLSILAGRKKLTLAAYDPGYESTSGPDSRAPAPIRLHKYFWCVFGSGSVRRRRFELSKKEFLADPPWGGLVQLFRNRHNLPHAEHER